MQKRKKINRLQPSEHMEQVAFFQWVGIMAARDERFKMIYAVPNGGSRHPAEAARMKMAGVKRGVPDISVDVPCEGFHGLKIEMKAGNNKPTPEQAEFLSRAAKYGYKTAVCFSAEEAIKCVEEYFKNR